jgi:hypothetical protein
MTTELLASIAGIVLSLAFSYLPRLSNWFDKLPPQYKRVCMGGLLVAVAGAVFSLSCGGIVASVACDRAGLLGLVKVLIAALIANQSAFLLTKRSAKWDAPSSPSFSVRGTTLPDCAGSAK